MSSVTTMRSTSSRPASCSSCARSRRPRAASAKTWTYRTMRARLSPRLLGLAADRAFRGDTLLALASEGRFLGVAWRARDARRSVVAGEIAPADATVYYHPVPGAESSTDVLVRALAGVMENGRPVVVVS